MKYWYSEWKIIEIIGDGVFPQDSLISFDRKSAMADHLDLVENGFCTLMALVLF